MPYERIIRGRKDRVGMITLNARMEQALHGITSMKKPVIASARGYAGRMVRGSMTP